MTNWFKISRKRPSMVDEKCELLLFSYGSEISEFSNSTKIASRGSFQQKVDDGDHESELFFDLGPKIFLPAHCDLEK